MVKNWHRAATDPEFRKLFEYKARIKQLILQFFTERGFIEFDFPSLIPAPAIEDHLELFRVDIDHANGTRARGFLSGTPELQIKKAVIGGFEKPFTFARAFRNGDPFDFSHNPEFTMLEWYRKGGTFKDVTQDFLELLRFLVINTEGVRKTKYLSDFRRRKVDMPSGYDRCDTNYQILNLRPTELLWQGRVIDIDTFRWVSLPELFEQKFRQKLTTVFEDIESAKLFARRHGVSVAEQDDLSSLFFKVFIEQVEVDISMDPIVLYGFPHFEGALATRNKADPLICERAETFLAGFEIGNAYTELADWKEQLSRFKKSFRYRQKNNLHTLPIDWDFIEALRYENRVNPESKVDGFAGGIGTGFERICQILLDIPDISQIIFSPANQMWEVE